MTIPKQAVEQFPLDAEADIRVFNRVLAAITKSCTPGSLYHPEQSARDVMDIVRSLTSRSLVGVQRPEDVARAARMAEREACMEIISNMRISEAGLFDEAHSGSRGESRSNALYDAYQALRKAPPAALPHTGQPQEGEPQGHGEPCYYCGKPCDSLAGNPGEWPICLSHRDAPGVAKWHHASCVTSRLIENQPAPPPPVAESGWQEIKTAPKTGTRVLVAWDDSTTLPMHVELGRFRSGTGAGSGWCNTYGHAFGGNPTHWMPLPAPPSPFPFHDWTGNCNHSADLCSDCPPKDYPNDETRCTECPRRAVVAEKQTGAA
jgi:hypothetical protein